MNRLPAFEYQNDYIMIEESKQMRKERDRNLVTKWLEALRGDSYKQGAGHLHVVERSPVTGLAEKQFCCLGVFCDLAGADWYDHRKLYKNGDSGAEYATVMGTQRNEFTMPDSDRREEMGLTSGQVEELAVMNDSGRDFKTIADRIEEMLALNDDLDRQFGEQTNA